MLKDWVGSIQCLLNNLFPLHERVLACFMRSDYYLNSWILEFQPLIIAELGGFFPNVSWTTTKEFHLPLYVRCEHKHMTVSCMVTLITANIACEASVSVWFRSKKHEKKTVERDFRFWPGEKWNENQKMKEGEGEGKGKEGNACRQTPRFWKPTFASEGSAWLARQVEQQQLNLRKWRYNGMVELIMFLSSVKYLKVEISS